MSSNFQVVLCRTLVLSTPLIQNYWFYLYLNYTAIYRLSAMTIFIALLAFTRIVVIDFLLNQREKSKLHLCWFVLEQVFRLNEAGYIHDSHHTSTWLDGKAICLQITICNNTKGRESASYSSRHQATHMHTYTTHVWKWFCWGYSSVQWGLLPCPVTKGNVYDSQCLMSVLVYIWIFVCLILTSPASCWNTLRNCFSSSDSLTSA